MNNIRVCAERGELYGYEGHDIMKNDEQSENNAKM